MDAKPHPFLKWAGGKSQLLAQFAELYPPAHTVRRYIEPFLGSGAVFFEIRECLQPSRVTLADDDQELVNVYTVIRDEVEKVIRALTGHRSRHGREHYYRVRSQAPSRLSSATRAARLIYLNRTCFNGLYRENSKGNFNVPMGRYANPRILDAENLRAASAALKRARIEAGHFSRVLTLARKGDFIYFDPPYHPISETSYFTSYTRGSFTAPDQEDLAGVYSELARRGCRVMLSNSDCRFIRDLYRGFEIRTVLARRRINSNAGRRGPIREVVVLNYQPDGENVRRARRRAGTERCDPRSPRRRPSAG